MHNPDDNETVNNMWIDHPQHIRIKRKWPWQISFISVSKKTTYHSKMDRLINFATYYNITDSEFVWVTIVCVAIFKTTYSGMRNPREPFAMLYHSNNRPFNWDHCIHQYGIKSLGVYSTNTFFDRNLEHWDRLYLIILFNLEYTIQIQ